MISLLLEFDVWYMNVFAEKPEGYAVDIFLLSGFLCNNFIPTKVIIKYCSFINAYTFIVDQNGPGNSFLMLIKHSKISVSVENFYHQKPINISRCDCIAPMLPRLHWLPVCQQVDVMVLELIYQSLAGVALACHADSVSCCWTLSGAQSGRAVILSELNVILPTNEQQICRQKFLACRSPTAE